MNFQRFQANLIKAAEARDGWRHKPFPYGNVHWSNDRFTYIAIDGNYIVGIPNQFFYLDVKKVFDKPETNLKPFIDGARDMKLAIDTHITKEVELHGKKNQLHKFTVDEEAVYIDEKIYKEFYQIYLKDDAEVCKFTGSTARSPIYLLWQDEVLGVIMPVGVSGEKDVF